jgi:hypothetical protein
MPEREQLEQAILALEKQREVLGDDVVDAALSTMREKLSALIKAQEATQQRKLATVLFMDTVGSTSITHDLDPEDTMAMMDAALQRYADHGHSSWFANPCRSSGLRPGSRNKVGYSILQCPGRHQYWHDHYRR